LTNRRIDVHINSSDESKVVKACAFCKGKGTVPDPITGREKPCPAECDGGYNVFFGVVKPCGVCGGTGKKGKTLLNDPRKCPSCGGKGYKAF
jgi:hypothetical protein